MKAFDGTTGKDISSQTKFTVLYKDKWVALESVPAEKFNSNNVWKFKAECDGYEEEIFSLLIDWYQDTVYCNFNLQKKYDTKLKK